MKALVSLKMPASRKAAFDSVKFFALLMALASTRGAGAWDFYIEIDYMVDSDHTHKPSQEVIDAVVQMFACHGHGLTIEIDDALVHHDVLVRDPDDCKASLFDYDDVADSYGYLIDEHFDHAGQIFPPWHYAVFGHQFEDDACKVVGNGGLGQSPGIYFLVSLGTFDSQIGTPFDQATTLAHEFGHNLGLNHCNDILCEDDEDSVLYAGPYVPTKPSVMSYRYAFGGVRSTLQCFDLVPDFAWFKELDFSEGLLCTQIEYQLDEVLGTGMTSVDWNCDGDFSDSVSQDINGDRVGWCGISGNLTVLSDFDEWGYIANPDLYGINAQRPRRDISCFSEHQRQQLQTELTARGGCTQPDLEVEDCLEPDNVFLAPNGLPFGGSCNDPFGDIGLAQIFSDDHSAYFMLSGTYEEAEPSDPLILDKPGIYTCSKGSAVIK